MPAKTPWTAEKVAKRVAALAAEHSVPNRFQLREVIGDIDRVATMSVSRIAMLQWWAVNEHLKPQKLRMAYQARQDRDTPAYINVFANE